MNGRLLDPGEAAPAANLDDQHALLVIGCESAEVPQGKPVRQAIAIARDAGGTVDEDRVLVSDVPEEAAERQCAISAWRNTFLRAPNQRNVTAGLCLVADTLEMAVTWERWPHLDAPVRQALHDALRRICGASTVTGRFTHVHLSPNPFSPSLTSRSGSSLPPGCS